MIKETVEYDVSIYKKAQDIIGHITRYLWNSGDKEHNGFSGIRIRRNEAMITMLTISGNTLGLEGDESKLLFGFDLMEGYYPSGFCAKMKSGNKIIVIHCLDNLDDTETAAKRITHNPAVSAVLIHELIHYFDSKRNPQMFANSKNIEKDGNEKYFNDSSEYNAFFNNISHPLLSFLVNTEDADNNMIRRMAKGMGISNNFKKNLERCIKNNKWLAANDYMDFLNKRNKEALIKRLYKIHLQVIERLNRV